MRRIALRNVFVGVGAISLMAAFLWAITDSESFGRCIHEHKNHQSYHALYEESSYFVIVFARVRLHSACGFAAVHENGEAIVAFGTIFLFFATTGLWLATYRLWQTTAEAVAGGEKAAHAAIAAVAAANRHANESAALVAVTKDTAERQLRAYVSIIPGDIRRLEIGHEIIVEIDIVNHGRTPAHRVKYYGSVAILPKILSDDFKISEPDGVPTSGATLFPGPYGIKTTSVRANPLTQDEAFQLANSEEIRLYVFGSVTYEDVFGKERESQFLASSRTEHIALILMGATEPIEVHFVYNHDYTKAT